MLKELDLDALDKLIIELAFVKGVLNVIKTLAFNQLLSVIDEGTIANISCEALNKLEKVDQLLN